MPRILNMPVYRIYRGAQYTRVLIMHLVLNILGLWEYHSSKYAKVTHDSEYT